MTETVSHARGRALEAWALLVNQQEPMLPGAALDYAQDICDDRQACFLALCRAAVVPLVALYNQHPRKSQWNVSIPSVFQALNEGITDDTQKLQSPRVMGETINSLLHRVQVQSTAIVKGKIPAQKWRSLVRRIRKTLKLLQEMRTYL